MANIYQEQMKTQTPTARIGEMSTGSELRQTSRIFDAIDEKFQRKAAQHQQLARELYMNGSTIAIHNGLESLINNPNYASNPQALANEADKIAEDVYAQIEDPYIKQDVMVKYELTKNPYINRAYSNMYRKQNEELEYQTLVGLQKNMDDVGISIENVMDGTVGVDDLRIISESKGKLDSYLASKDVRGFNMFTPEQRVKLERQYNSNIVERLKGGYLQLDVHERQKIIDMLKNDEFGVSYTDDEGFTTTGDVKSILPTDSYLDFKDFVLRSHARALKKAGKSGQITQEEQELADRQMMNAILIESEMKNIQELKKDKPSERILHNLELMDNIDGMGDDGLTDSDRKKYTKETVSDLVASLKNPANTFEEWGRDSAISVGLQGLKNDGNMLGSAWGDDMSVVTMRDFYSMAKEHGLDLRAYDSSSREVAKNLMAKAIQNTQERVAGGYGKDYNSVFIHGRKVSRQPIKSKPEDAYVNTNYAINLDANKKTYNETQIEVDL